MGFQPLRTLRLVQAPLSFLGSVSPEVFSFSLITKEVIECRAYHWKVLAALSWAVWGVGRRLPLSIRWSKWWEKCLGAFSLKEMWSWNRCVHTAERYLESVDLACFVLRASSRTKLCVDRVYWLTWDCPNLGMKVLGSWKRLGARHARAGHPKVGLIHRRSLRLLRASP